MPKPFSVVTGTIASGQSLSGAIDLSAGNLASILLPPLWTGAILTFQGSQDGASFADLRSVGGELMRDVKEGALLIVDPGLWGGIIQLKLRSGTSAAPIPQAADRVFKIAIIG